MIDDQGNDGTRQGPSGGEREPGPGIAGVRVRPYPCACGCAAEWRVPNAPDMCAICLIMHDGPIRGAHRLEGM